MGLYGLVDIWASYIIELHCVWKLIG